MALGLVPISDDLKRKFAESVDLTKCPAFHANWAFHEGANLDPTSARKSDIPDLWHRTGVAYCDVAFVDKRTVEVLRKGAYDKLPQRNSEFPGWVQSLVLTVSIRHSAPTGQGTPRQSRMLRAWSIPRNARFTAVPFESADLPRSRPSLSPLP